MKHLYTIKVAAWVGGLREIRTPRARWGGSGRTWETGQPASFAAADPRWRVGLVWFSLARRALAGAAGWCGPRGHGGVVWGLDIPVFIVGRPAKYNGSRRARRDSPPGRPRRRVRLAPTTLADPRFGTWRNLGAFCNSSTFGMAINTITASARQVLATRTPTQIQDFLSVAHTHWLRPSRAGRDVCSRASSRRPFRDETDGCRIDYYHLPAGTVQAVRRWSR
jgi:hypothetical protein